MSSIVLHFSLCSNISPYSRGERYRLVDKVMAPDDISYKWWRFHGGRKL